MIFLLHILKIIIEVCNTCNVEIMKTNLTNRIQKYGLQPFVIVILYVQRNVVMVLMVTK